MRAPRIGSVLVVAWGLLGLATPAAATPERLPFTDFAHAVETARTERKVTVVYFTAEWCSWCQRLERDTFRDERVRAAADDFQWARVDVDEQPYLAGALRVRGVPMLLLLNADGEPLDQHGGFIGAARFADWLDAHANDAETPGQARRRFEQLVANLEALNAYDAEHEGSQRQAFINIIEQVAAGEGGGPAVARRATEQMGEAADPILVQLLSHKALTVRAAAHELLRDRHHSGPTFDPFGEIEDRQQQQHAWMQWIVEQHESTEHDVDESPDESTTDVRDKPADT